MLPILRMYLLPFAFLAFENTYVYSQPASEKGNYLSIQNFTPGDYLGRSQIFDITEDNRGILYFGNGDGILVYDGTFWSSISDFSEAVYSIESDINGIVYVGGEDEIGYLNTDPIGRQKFVSLLPYLDSGMQNFGEIWNINASKTDVFFNASNHLFKWNGDSIISWHTDHRFQSSFYVNKELYVRESGRGLLILQNDSLVLIEGGEKFKNIAIKGMIPNKEAGIMIFTESDGIFNMIPRGKDGSKIVIRHFNEIDNFMFENTVSCALRINFNQFVIGSEGLGAVVYDQSNDQYDFLNYASGLQDEVIYNMHIDKRGNLWLALSNGISMSPVGTPVTSFGHNSGIKESVEGITRYTNKLFLTTILGTYYLDIQNTNRNTSKLSTKNLENQQVFRKLTDIDEQCYACTRFITEDEDLLLIATYTGITQIERSLKTKQILDCYPWFIYQSKIHSNRVIIANEDGVKSIYRNKEKWIKEPSLEEIKEDCRIVVEDQKGNVWIGTSNSGKAYKIKFNEPGSEKKAQLTVFDSTNSLPGGDIYIKMFENELLFGTSDGLFRFNEDENIFYADTSFGVEFSNRSKSIHRISVDHEGFMWLVTFNKASKEYETGYFTPSYDGSYTWINEPFLIMSKGVIHSIYHDPDGVTWLGGPDGLYRYDRKIKKDFILDYNTLVHEFSIKGDSLIFGGTFTNAAGIPTVHQNQEEIPIIKHRFNSVAIEYGAPNNEDGSPVLFSHFLKGFDDGWHDWSQEYRREYTNLHNGTYTFHVKARNLYKHESAITSYTFIIQPPWYLRIPVIIGFGLLIIGLIWFIVILYTRGLKSIIRDRTAEIREQKEMIEEKNQDILGSITYAQRIQSAMLTPGDYLDGLFPERFILYMPRDIVSGDFYWMIEKNDRIICVTADCTGHGVPGAMMSMMGMSYLNEITSREHDIHSDEILNQLRNKIVNSLRQKGIEGESQDGMDLALYIVDIKNKSLEFSGANLPLYLFRKGDLQIIKPDKMPIGISSHLKTPFTRISLDLEAGDILYTFSDGFQDQFGGPRNKKFLIKKLRQLLIEIHSKPLRQQKNILKKNLDDWMFESNCEQVDDITLLGVKI